MSFVTHIIFLDVLMDKAVETQTVARAWRMGAKGPVNVETLIAENSIEKCMFNLEQGESKVSSTGIQKFGSTVRNRNSLEYQRAKVHYLLQNLKLIANTSTLGFGTENKRKAPDLKRQDSIISAVVQKQKSKKRCVQFQVPH